MVRSSWSIGKTPKSRTQQRPIDEPSSTVSMVIRAAPAGTDMVSHGRNSSLMPSGVTARAQTSAAGADTGDDRSTSAMVSGRPQDVAATLYSDWMTLPKYGPNIWLPSNKPKLTYLKLFNEFTTPTPAASS